MLAYVEIAHLESFVAVAEELHFGRAAERLHLTASPVSRMVKDLERELGRELFSRSHHHVELTAFGELLIDQARTVLAAIDCFKVDANRALGSGRVTRIGAPFVIPPTLTSTFHDSASRGAAPGTVELVWGPTAELIPAVERGDLLLALVHLPIGESMLASATVASYSFHIAMRLDDPLAERDSLVLSELSERTLIAFPNSVHPLAVDRVTKKMREAGITKFEKLSTSDHILAAALVRHGRALALTLDPSAGGPASAYTGSMMTTVPLREGELDLEVAIVWDASIVGRDVVSRQILETVKGVPFSLADMKRGFPEPQSHDNIEDDR